MSSMFPIKSLFVVLEMSGQPDILKMFLLVATGHLRPFPTQVVHISHCCGRLQLKIILFLPFPGILKKKLFFRAPNWFIPSVMAPDVVSLLFLC